MAAVSAAIVTFGALAPVGVAADPAPSGGTPVDGRTRGLRSDAVGAPDAATLGAAVAGAAGADRHQPAGSVLWEDRNDRAVNEQAFSAAANQDQAFAVGYVSRGRAGRDGVVRAYDLDSGDLQWEDLYDLGADDFASGVVTEGRRVFASGSSFRTGTGYDWVLRAYDAESGAVLWTTGWDRTGGRDFSRGTALAVAGGRVFLGGYGTSAAGDADWVVRAHDAATGALLWSDVLRVGDGFDIAYTIAAEGDQVFVGGGGDNEATGIAVLRSYHGRTGSLLWDHRRSGLPGITYVRSVRAAGGTVVAGISVVQPDFLSRAVVAAYRATSGAELWAQRFDDSDWQWIDDVAAAEGIAVATGQGGPACTTAQTSNCAAVVRTFDLERGTPRWTNVTQLSPLDDTASTVAIDGGDVFVLSLQNATHFLPGCCTIGQWVMQSFDRSSGALEWRSIGRPLESGVYNMVVHSGVLVVPGRTVNDPDTGSWDFLVRAYDARGRGGTIEPLPFVLTPEIFGSGTSGQATFEVSNPVPLTALAYGLAPGAKHEGVVVDDPANNVGTAYSSGVGVTIHMVTVPAGARLARFALFDGETTGADDLDLYVLGPNGEFASSAGVTSAEIVDFEAPAAGVYEVIVHGYQTEGSDTAYALYSWGLHPVNEGNLTVAGPSASGSGTVTVSWSGLVAGSRYLGDISLRDGTNEVGHTLVTVAA